MEKNRNDNLRDIRQAAKAELENLISDYGDENLGKPKRMTRVIVKKAEVVAFVRKFIEETITEPNLKQKLLYNLDNNVLKLKTSFFKDTGGFNRPVYGKNGEVSIEREAWFGYRMLNGKIMVDLKTIRGIVHELIHSVTPKFDIERIKRARRENRYHEKDPSIGEIESKIIEKFYSEYLLENADRLEKEGVLGLTAEQIKKDVIEMQASDLIELIQKTKESQDPNKNEVDQRYCERYVFGGIYADMFAKHTLKNGKDKIKLFSEYLSQNADMNLDDAAMFLSEGELKPMQSEGKFKPMQVVIDKFVNDRIPSSKKLDDETLSSYRESKKQEHFVAEMNIGQKREPSLNEIQEEIQNQK